MIVAVIQMRLTLLSLFLCALIATTTAVTNVSAQSSSCGFDGYDFSSLSNHILSGSDSTGEYEYYLSVCGVIDSVKVPACAPSLCVEGVCTHMSACEVDTTGHVCCQ